MKKLLIFLLLFIAINPQITFSQNITINNFFQKRLDAILQQSLGQMQDYTTSVKGDIVKRKIFTEKTISLETVLDEKTAIKPFWIVFFPDKTIHLYDIARDGMKVSGNFIASIKGGYRAELWNMEGEKIFEKTFNLSEIAKGSVNIISYVHNDIQNKRLLQKNAIMRYDNLLQNIAIKKAIDMAEKSYIGHSTPYGEDIFSFIEGNINKYFRLGENVAGGEDVTMESLYQGLLKSSSHYDAMVLSDWKKIGMAFVDYNNNQYFVQIFSD